MATTDHGLFMLICCVVIFIPYTAKSEENIALGKSTTQSSDYKSQWQAQNAVDGCTNQDIYSGCCSHTNGGQSSAWWRVDLQQLVQIDRIVIFYRGSDIHRRFAGYKLYVSNTTELSQGVLCYQDTSSTIEEVKLNQTLQCPFVGRYVIIFNERQNPKRYSWYSDNAFLELCEVQVFGCPVGFYGNGTCTDTCPSTCTGHGCNPSTGHCFYCDETEYGNMCELECPANCRDRICNRSGHCLDCVAGKQGGMCELDCPKGCKNDMCNKTGHCFGCVSHNFGPLCEEACSENCINSLCDEDSGYCLNCITGKYGNICEKDCPNNCRDNECYDKTGFCHACKVGYHGYQCEEKCNLNCEEEKCNQINGTCEVCKDGIYDHLCDKECPRDCKSKVCHRYNGTCIACNDGLYGRNCDLSCPDNCENKICDISNGLCLECISGKYGHDCENTCPEVCDSKRCRRLDGACETDPDNITVIAAIPSCLAALFFLTALSEAILILKMKRKAKSLQEKASHYTDLGTLGRNDDNSQNTYEVMT